MANNFNSDEHCISWWRFENGVLPVDEKSKNTLRDDYNWDPPVADTENVWEGTASAYFERGVYGCFWIDDPDLSADFPLKYGTANRSFSLTLAFRPILDNWWGAYWLVAKSGGSSVSRSFEVLLYQNDPGDWRLYVKVGADSYFQADNVGVTLGAWHHLGLTYEDATQTLHLRLYDASDESIQDFSVATLDPIPLRQAEWIIGHEDGDGTMNIDEVAIFDDILSSEEIDAIRQANYGEEPPEPPVDPIYATGAATATTLMLGCNF